MEPMELYKRSDLTRLTDRCGLVTRPNFPLPVQKMPRLESGGLRNAYRLRPKQRSRVATSFVIYQYRATST
jgi:hypothetical protein